MSSEPAQSSVYAVALLGSFIQAGVTDVVVCPGSRSQALALAAAEAERAGAIRLHVRTDERSAGFFALGLARESGVPAPVIVTSGSAVANLLPAALEAHEARVPMLLLTADRPADMRGTRSNQTTRQFGLFDSVARFSTDIDVDAVMRQTPGQSEGHAPAALATRAMRAALGRVGGAPAGPVQLNLQLREPLSGWPEGARLDFGGGEMLVGELMSSSAAQREVIVRPTFERPQPEITDAGWRTRLDWHDDECYRHEDDALAVVIAGDGAANEAAEFARKAGLPLLAEVVSGARFGREAIMGYATLLETAGLGDLVERAVVFGHPTLTRAVPALLKRDDVEVVVVDPYAGDGVDHYDPIGGARVVRAARVAESHDSNSMKRWLGAWVVADRELRELRSTQHTPDLDAARATGYKERSAYARAEVAALREPVSREMLAEMLWLASWPHDRLVLAASRLVRVLDGVAVPRAVEVRANRGLAGIDGTVATALGIATASQNHEDLTAAAGVTRVLIGDLALLHDAGSLLIPEAEPRPRVQLFVGNDGGGTIFDTLEAAETAPRDAFDRVMFTPHRVELESLARAYGWRYRRVDTRGELDRLLTEPVTGPEIIEVPLSR